jgi:hypothetical protein
MSHHEVVFEIDSSADARAVERLVEHARNAVREELRTSGEGLTAASETLEQFEALREATLARSHGTLTIEYETVDAED